MTALLSPGEVIPGTRYRVIARVGEGAMGAIYAAEHIDLEKKVALKTLLPEIARVPEAVERFRQEARAASKIGSPYICDVTDFGNLPDGQVFFVMEYLEGQSLAQVLDKEGPITAARAIGILRQTCKALGAAHDKGIIHLDVKPDNVMLIADRHHADAVKVVDFGIAGLLEHGGREDKIAGTPEYIPPERATGAGYDSRSDIYSLGVLAYEALTGKVPFEDKDPVMVLRKQVSQKPRPPRELAPDMPPRLEQLILQMLAKDPGARPQRMDVVEAMLCEAQIEGGFETPWDGLPLPPVDEAWRRKLAQRMPGRGGPRRAVVVAAVVVALVGAGLALYLGVIREPEQIIKVVRVPVTNTEEPVQVAAALEKADQAGRAQKFVRPAQGSALHFIEVAEAAAASLGRKSAGAESLRTAYASALSATGEELLAAGLRDLAVVRFKDALRFRPDDGDLARKADVTAAERRAFAKRTAATEPASAPAAPVATAPRDELKEAAAQAFLAAKGQRYSEARVALKRVSGFDKDGQTSAKLADALRQLAATTWDKGDHRNGRPLYQLVLLVDPDDLEAQARSRLEEPSPPPPEEAPAPVVAAPAPAPEKSSRHKDRRVAERSLPSADVPRDERAAEAAVRIAQAAMARGDLKGAEAAFSQALRADPLSADAVGGLAEVAFERADYTYALDLGRRATRLAPQVAKPHIVLGDAYFKLLRFAEAKTAYQTAEKLLGGKNAQVAARLERVNARLTP